MSKGPQKPKGTKRPQGRRAPQRHLFPREFVIDRNATQAAIRCGYSKRSARNQGARLMANEDIRLEIEQRTKKIEEKVELSAERVLAELSLLAFVDLGKAYDDRGNLLAVRDIPDDVRRALAGLEVDELWEGSGEDRRQIGVTRKVKLLDKIRALELLGKRFKLWVDRVEHSADEELTELLAMARERYG